MGRRARSWTPGRAANGKRLAVLTVRRAAAVRRSPHVGAAAMRDDPRTHDRRCVMTILWFLIWLVASLVGSSEPLALDPVNGWTATLIAAAALDLNRPPFPAGKKS
jgi:hypothetical protein